VVGRIEGYRGPAPRPSPTTPMYQQWPQLLEVEAVDARRKLEKVRSQFLSLRHYAQPNRSI
jgi:hypothetical protein